MTMIGHCVHLHPRSHSHSWKVGHGCSFLSLDENTQLIPSSPLIPVTGHALDQEGTQDLWL